MRSLRWQPTRTFFLVVPVLVLGSLAALSMAQANCFADDKGTIDGAKVATSRRDAVDFLRTTQADDGSWTSPTAPGVSGLITTAILHAGVSPADPMVDK